MTSGAIKLSCEHLDLDINVIHPLEYDEFVMSATRDRKLMARIGLNCLYNSNAFPVDIRELKKLSPINRAVVNGFLAWCSTERPKRVRWPFTAMRELLHIADALDQDRSRRLRRR